MPVPAAPEAKAPSTGIDLGKILLPKKDAPGKSVDSAQRVNAGALLQSEQTAVLPKTPAPAPAAQPKKEATGVRSIETYQGDIEGLVQSKNVSILSIAAAEAARRGAQVEAPAQSAPIDIKAWAQRIGLIAGGVVLLVAAAGALFWVLQPPRAVDVPLQEDAPFIQVDATKALTVPEQTFTHSNFIRALEDQRSGVALSLGLMERLQLGVASTTAAGQAFIPLSAAAFVRYLSPSVPDTLLRSIEPNTYLLGIHSFDGNQPFLILKADSYEGAYAGMLAWEPYMRADLSPLFVRVPPVLIRTAPSAPVATTTATSTEGSAASSTDDASPPAPEASPVNAGFIDRIVENHDARVLQNADEQILLLWTFINRNVLVITTNEATLREIISRLRSSPIVPTP